MKLASVPATIISYLLVLHVTRGTSSTVARQPFGPKMCGQLCQQCDGCYESIFNPGHLLCEVYTHSKGQHQAEHEVTGIQDDGKTVGSKYVTDTSQIPKHSLGLDTGMGKGYKRIAPDLYVKKHSEKLTWNKALQVCQSEGANLIKIDSKKKQRRFHKVFRFEDSLWIGLSDRYDNDSWFWSDGAPLSGHHSWGGTDPHLGQDNCVLSVSHWLTCKWFDVLCNKKLKYVCEKYTK